MSEGSVMELDYQGTKILAYEMWVAAVPETGTIILGETIEQAKVKLKELEKGNKVEGVGTPSNAELQLRLILSTPNAARRTELLGDWLKIWARDQARREEAQQPPHPHWLTQPEKNL